MSKHSTRYSAGQSVEVLRPDFTKRDAPWTWQNGVVDRVQPVTDTLVDVFVRLPDGSWSPQRVGPRGGNKRIRPAS